MSSSASAFNNFLQSLVGIGQSILHAIMAIFYSVFALGQEVLTGAISLVTAVAALATDLVQDTVGFVFGECHDSVYLDSRLTCLRSQLLPPVDPRRCILLVDDHPTRSDHWCNEEDQLGRGISCFVRNT